MAEKETNKLTCPFCGAPIKEFVSADTMQVKCQYCGGVFQVPPTIGANITRCQNHPDRFAAGLCNDCGQSFCAECLHSYNLVTRDTNEILYLCPTCLRNRYTQKANSIVFVGIVLTMIGIVIFFLNWFLGAIVSVLGVGAVAYGLVAGNAEPDEPTVDEIRTEDRNTKTQLAETSEVDVEGIYNELLGQYITKWGVTSGHELLDNEIMAYVRHGESYSEALSKMYQDKLKGPLR